MNKNDFMLYLWGFPFLGGFLGFILASVLQTGEAAAGIMIMLGVIAGFAGLLTYVLGLRFVKNQEL